jgi:hypothetical protein
MRTAASEHMNHAQVMARLGTTFGALVHEQIEVVRRFLAEQEASDSSELAGIAELSVRLVERSAEWLEIHEVASLALEMRQAMAQLGSLRPSQRQDVVAQCRVALATEERLADRLRAEGFAELVAHATQVDEAVEALRASIAGTKSDLASGVIDGATPDVGPHENLLALTFEIKNSLIHQNERICTMNETVDGTLRAAQTVLGDWEGLVKAVERQRMAQGGKGEGLPAAKTLTMHQRLQELTSSLHSLAHDLSQVLGLQYSLERRARDLDEHLLWEFLDPLERYMDDLYTAAARGREERERLTLTVHTGGVGFEPEIGSLLLPLLERVLEGAEAMAGAESFELRMTAAREGLEARVAIEGQVRFDEESLRLLENGLESLGGFATVRESAERGTRLCIQFPMARSLRSFLIVEAGGQRMALPWSAVERIYASDEEPAWEAERPTGPVHSLAALFHAAGDAEEAAAPGSGSASAAGEDGHPVAVLRCGSGRAVVGFDRIVWRENARLKALPPRLYPVEEILGGIFAPDGGITLVLNPAALLRRLSREHAAANGAGA